MRLARLIFAFAALSAATLAQATDKSDLWWNANESGWGVNVSHQGNTLFLTFFVYSSSGQPTWVVGPSTQFQYTDASGANIYSGPLYQTTGPWFGGPFNPSAVNVVPVGTATWTANTVTTATLTYSISGISVTKSLTRQTFASNPFVSGNYIGGFVGDSTGCPVASNNGHFEGGYLVSVSGSVSSMQLVLQGTFSCTVTGPYSQDGRMGTIRGSITCTNGNSGNAQLFEVEANNSGVTGRWQASYINGCSETGHFAGVRR